jgi:Zn-finger nucleic acid-binding protein
MASVTVGPTAVQECARCDGLWVEQAAFVQICAEKEQQRNLLGPPKVLSQTPPQAAGQIRYVPCPECRKLMNRVNFANCSGVIVDVCRDHGTWFDRDELRRIVEFIRAGGMDLSRERKRAELLQQEQRLRRLQAASAAERERESRREAVLAAGGLLGYGW